MSKRILVTGGAGYIGSHTIKELLNHNYEVIVLDNLSSGFIKAVDSRAKLIIGDVRDLGLLNSVFTKYEIDGIIHFAAKIAVGESVKNPLSYYDNNCNGVLAILRAMKFYKVENIVFSSTAAVYGTSNKAITEDAPLNPLSSYGKSKLIAENLIRDSAKAYGFNYCIFRYFNVAGASKDSSIGEAHPNETHLIPNVVLSNIKNREFTIFGNDYQTRDGTNLRDYVHVLDLARAHILGLEMIMKNKKSDIINLGSKEGFTNLEIVRTVEEVLDQKINYKIGPRREGDVDAIVASNMRAKEVLDWSPEYNLKDMIQDDYNWRIKNPNLYGKNSFKGNNIKKIDSKISAKKIYTNLFEPNENIDILNLNKFKNK